MEDNFENFNKDYNDGIAEDALASEEKETEEASGKTEEASEKAEEVSEKAEDIPEKVEESLRELKDEMVPEAVEKAEETVFEAAAGAGNSTLELAAENAEKGKDISEKTISEESIKDIPREEPVYRTIPPYSTYKTTTNAGGNISYSPVISSKEEKKKAKKKGRKALVAILVVCGILLSTGFGMLGSYITSEHILVKNTQEIKESSGDESSAQKTDEGKTVLYQSVDKVTTSSDGSKLTIADVAEKVSDSVVAITTEYTSMGIFGSIASGGGSGVIISEDGYLITNHHVIFSDSLNKYADNIKVTLNNGDEYDAAIVGFEASEDIAVLKIEGEEFTCAVFGNSDSIVVGEEAIVIGNPLGKFQGTVTNGIISATGHTYDIEGTELTLIQTNAAINLGNSGGGLFNMNAELIGIVNAKSYGTGIEGLGFAIPSNTALSVATAIIESAEEGGTGQISAGTTKIGVTFYNVTSLIQAQQLGVNGLGIYVYQLEDGLNDDVLKVGDRIIAMDGAEVTDGDEIVEKVHSCSPGDTIEFMLYREGRLVTVNVKCY